MATEALKNLHQILIDTGSGYRKAAEEADDARLRALFADVASSRQLAQDEIAGVLQAQGETADDDGSFMETVHRTVIAVRSAVKGLDRDALPSFVSGEDNVIEKFDEALAEQKHHAEAFTIIDRHRAVAVEQIEAMKREANA